MTKIVITRPPTFKATVGQPQQTTPVVVAEKPKTVTIGDVTFLLPNGAVDLASSNLENFIIDYINQHVIPNTNVATALVIAQGAYEEANLAYNSAANAANTASVTVGGISFPAHKINIQNTNTVIAFLTDTGNGNANLAFVSVGGGGGNGSGSVTEIDTGLGLFGGPISITGVIRANIAATDKQGITKLVDSVVSTDTGNAATANAVTTAYALANAADIIALAAYAEANTANAQANLAYDEANVASTTANAALILANNMLMTVSTTANGTTVVLDSFSTSLYTTIKYIIQASAVNRVHSLEFLGMQDGISSYDTLYGELYNNGSMGDFHLVINGANAELQYTPTNPTLQLISLKIIRFAIVS